MAWVGRFEALAARKIAEAARADLAPLTTVCTAPATRWTTIGNEWTWRLYDGGFPLAPSPDQLPALTTVFVQSRTGNTGAERPQELGGGDVDRHLIYEGLSRVAADAVLAGARTAIGDTTFFSVWHPGIVALRQSLGLARHPLQVVVSRAGHLDVDGTMLFNVPDVTVIVLGGCDCLRRSRRWRWRRPWLRVLPLEADWRGTLQRLRSEFGIKRISVVGGRATASALIDAGVVADLVLTTTSRDAGEPHTPYYVGQERPGFTLVTEKHGLGSDGPIRIEHFAIDQVRQERQQSRVSGSTASAPPSRSRPLSRETCGRPPAPSEAAGCG